MKNTARVAHRNLIITLCVIALAALAAFSAGWYYILRFSSESNRLNTEANNYLEESEALSDLKLNLAKVSGEKDAVYMAIPKSKDVSDFLASFEDLAKTDNLAITSTNVGDPKTKTKSGSDFSQTIAMSQYYELPENYEVSGNYVALTKLIADLSVQKRLVSVDNLVVTAESTDVSGNVPLGQIRATFELTVYVKK